MRLTKRIKRAVSSLFPSPIQIDFEKGGGRYVQDVAPYPAEVFWDDSVPIHKTHAGVEYVRTPESQFEKLPGYDFTPNYVEVDGLRMHYLDEGPRDGELILLLHGQPVWSYLYRKMIPILTGHGYRCIAPDMIGMGRSDKPIKESYHTYDKHCELMLSFIQQLKLEKITAFIQDWGSVIGTRLAGENPDLFSRLVLANGDLPLSTEGTNPLYIPNPVVVNPKVKSFKDIIRYWLKGLPYSFQAWVLFCLQNSRNFIGGIMQQTTVNVLSEGEIAAYEAPFPSFIYMAGPRTLPSMNVGIIGQQLEAWESLKKYEKPFISFIGLKDSLLGRPRIQDKWINNVPGAKGQDHEQFENANHFIQEDLGEIMADRTHRFIQKNPM
jgi:pimeloyl-ACP methyl ester carboxylesterase